MSSVFAPAPPPATKLGLYRTLSPHAAIRVSPLALGAMSIGDKWQESLGAMDKESSMKLLDAFYEKGGNFIDTANNYQDGSSEEIIGEWMEARGIRDEIVLATKYTTMFKRGDNSIKNKALLAGNNLKSLKLSVESSLKRLRTSYVDILYVHWWDWETSIEEVMDGLHNLVTSGKVLYLGASDTPAWVVSQANQYARDHGKSPFVIYQGRWSILDRSFEREIIPMARTNNLAIAPWGVLAGGRLRTDAEEEERRKAGGKGRMLFSDNNAQRAKSGLEAWERDEDERKVSQALEKIAKEVGAKSIQAVAIAYLMQKVPYVFPIMGGRKVEQLDSNIEALDIALSNEQIAELESVVPFDLGFPGSMIGTGSDTNPMLFMGAHYVKQPLLQAIRPTKNT